MRRNTSSLRYSPWLAADVARGPGVFYLVVMTLLLVIFWRVSRSTSFDSSAAMVQTQVFTTVQLVAVLIATGGMVSTDSQEGFYRAWFCKPMAPWWYYLQRWLIGGAFVLALPLVFGSGLAVVLGDGHGVTPLLLGHLALAYLLIGSAVFLLSTLMRRDWLIVGVLSFAVNMIHTISQTGLELHPLVRAVHRALPPFHLLDPSGPALGGMVLLHVAGYGVGMLMLALLVLARRPLGSGGRA